MSFPTQAVLWSNIKILQSLAKCSINALFQGFSHTVLKQWCFTQQHSLNIVVKRGKEVMMSKARVLLKPCRTNMFHNKLALSCKRTQTGETNLLFVYFSSHTKKTPFFPASRVERISLTSMCWIVYFILLKCPEREHYSVNKHETTCLRLLPSSEAKQMCSNEHSSSTSFCIFSIFQMQIFELGIQGHMLKNKPMCYNALYIEIVMEDQMDINAI